MCIPIEKKKKKLKMVENSDWRICRGVALAIGWLSIFVNCGLIYIIFAYPGQFGRNLHETLIPILPGKPYFKFINLFFFQLD